MLYTPTVLKRLLPALGLLFAGCLNPLGEDPGATAASDRGEVPDTDGADLSPPEAAPSDAGAALDTPDPELTPADAGAPRTDAADQDARDSGEPR